MLLSSFFTTSGMDDHPATYLFSLTHLIYFLSFLALFILFFIALKKLSSKKQKILITISLILILVLKYATEILFIYEYYNQEPLPSTYPHPFFDVNTFISFQLCGVMNIFLPLVVWFDLKKLKPFVYLTSILGGLAVVLYPVTVLYGNPFTFTLPMVRSMLVHFFLVLIPLFLIHQGDIKLKRTDAYSIAIGLLTVAAWAMFGNLFLDGSANNMYLMENPFFGTNIPFLNIIPDGYHVILLAIMVTGGYFLVYRIAKLFEKKSD